MVSLHKINRMINYLDPVGLPMVLSNGDLMFIPYNELEGLGVEVEYFD